MPSILDKSFRYTPAASTDIRRTFNRVRKQIAAAQVGRDDHSEAGSNHAMEPVPAATPKLAYRRSA